MNEKPLYIASCSFGKDSVATILLALENNEPLDRVVFVEVMFDHERGISGEDPTHIEWVYSVAIPKLEAMGVKVDVVKSDADYIGWATQPIAKSSHPDRIGKKRVWLLQGRCSLNRDGKLKAIRNYYRQFTQPIVQYVGIANDEPIRLARLEGHNKISLLAKYGYTEADAWRKCEEYGLLSPFYGLGYKRNGCWFCPNKPLKYLAYIRRDYPHLWEELRKLAVIPNKVSENFNKRYSFSQLEVALDHQDKIDAFNEAHKQQNLF
ncbi:MAG: hypothetical protein J6U49_01000 [Alistipes sp.]|nr:hypothetical protein [Alistipes sp.]